MLVTESVLHSAIKQILKTLVIGMPYMYYTVSTTQAVQFHSCLNQRTKY
jgi:hypothetical protein